MRGLALTVIGGLTVVFIATVAISFREALSVGRAPDRAARLQLASLGGMIVGGALLVSSAQIDATAPIAITTAVIGIVAISYAVRRRRF